jgi:S-adenosylmethionine synthetase
MNNEKYLTAESVTEGHPDKLCDLIADSILDACLRKDKLSRVACEVLATKGRIVVAGEITCRTKIDIPFVVRMVLKDVGYDPKKFSIVEHIHNQSSDIATGVDTALEVRNGEFKPYGEIGAGDQGIVYGYATDETREYLPLPVVLAHNITRRLTKVRKDGLVKGLMPDGKAQVTIEYENEIPKRVKTIIVSTQHTPEKSQEELRKDIIQWVLWDAFDSFPFDGETEILVNPSGRFVFGGPQADTGLTGRKLMVDTYGGLASHGGGAFSGKDGTKVDRSGAYMARYIAKNILDAHLAKKCEISISYAIGKADPVAVDVCTFGTGTVSDSVIRDAVLEVFNLRPAAIIEKLHLRDARFADTAVYGHFSNFLNHWEWTDKKYDLKEAVEKLEHSED